MTEPSNRPTGFSLETANPEEFESRISPLSGTCRVRPVRGSQFGVRVRAVPLATIGMFVIRSPSLMVDSPPPHTYYGLNIPLGRPFDAIDEFGHRNTYLDDAHWVRADRVNHVCAPEDMRCLAVKFYGDAVDSFGLRLSGFEHRFKPTDSDRLARERRPALRMLVTSVIGLWSDLMRRDTPQMTNIDLAEREDALLTQFVLTTATGGDSDPQNSDTVGSRALAVAEDYLEARLTRPVSRADLAAAAGVSIRTLSRAFAKRWGVGPMAFLKARRMEAAYRDLLGADRGETTVSAVLSRYGFGQRGRFSVEYRAAFRESPSETLRH